MQCLWIIYWKQRKNKKIKETGDSGYIYQNEIGKTCFQTKITYGNFKIFSKRAAFTKLLHNKEFFQNI